MALGLRPDTIYPIMRKFVISKRFLKSVWLFPGALAVLLILLTVFQLSGTSVGEYHSKLYGPTKDPDLLLNEPQAIRSDEWLVTTQMTIAQHAAGYPRINHNIFNGRDMSVVGDAPYKDWSMVFRPQNLAFFILPLGYAFAFKWWLLLFLTVIGSYFIVLRFFPGKRLLAALLGSAFGLSPFFFWWYQTTTFAPVFYGLFIILVGIRIINDEKALFLKKRRLRYSQGLYVALLSYLLIAFFLVLYPPFQIPVAVGTAAFLTGYFLEKYGSRDKLLSKESFTKIGFFAVGAVIAGLVILAFVHSRSNALYSLQHTVYPGDRKTEGGGAAVVDLFSTYLQPQLEHTSRAIQYGTNQSEASNFLLFVPFLTLPGFVLLGWHWIKRKRLDWPLLMVQLCIALFLVNMFVPSLQPLYKLFLLDNVPHARLIIGLGFVGILQLICIMRSLVNTGISQKKLSLLAAGYSLLCLIALLMAGLNIRSNYPGFIHNLLLIAIAALLFTAIIFCFLSRRFILGAAFFFLFSLACVIHIHPLYRGLGVLDDNRVFTAIDHVSKPGSSWVTLDSLAFENFASMSGRDSLSGVQPYPDLSFWRQIEGPSGAAVYNRYAHVLFNTTPPLNDPLALIAPDRFEVQFACTPFIEQHVQFALATHPVQLPCLRQVDTVQYPAQTFYLYQVSQ